MNWDSALGLKAQLLESLWSVPSTTSRRGTRVVDPNPLALGIAPNPNRPGDFLLAIRSSNRGPVCTLALEKVLAEVGAAEVDHLVTGRIDAHRTISSTPVIYGSRRRPLQPGFSVGHYRGRAGTLGAFVKRKPRGHEEAAESDAVYLLSSTLALTASAARIGDPVLQPGPRDGGSVSKDFVAAFEQSLPDRGVGAQFADAALARLRRHADIVPTLDRVPLRGIQPSLRGGEAVLKIGRTTGRTAGVVTAVALDQLVIDYAELRAGSARRKFDDQIEIRARSGYFSQGGDEGALVVDPTGLAVGLLLAGSEHRDLSYASPIQTILETFDASLIC